MISKASKENIKELLALENEVFDPSNFPISKPCFYYHLKNNYIYIYKINGTIAGYILWLKRKSYYRLYSLAVKPTFRGKSVASKLLEHSFLNLRDKQYYSLEVKEDNLKAIELYQKYDFKSVKLLKNYYPDMKNAYRMEKLNS